LRPSPTVPLVFGSVYVLKSIPSVTPAKSLPVHEVQDLRSPVALPAFFQWLLRTVLERKVTPALVTGSLRFWATHHVLHPRFYSCLPRPAVAPNDFPELLPPPSFILRPGLPRRIGPVVLPTRSKPFEAEHRCPRFFSSFFPRQFPLSVRPPEENLSEDLRYAVFSPLAPQVALRRVHDPASFHRLGKKSHATPLPLPTTPFLSR